MGVRESDYVIQRHSTELGELPADWRVVAIDELQPFITSGSRGWATYYSESGSTFLRITNLSRECIYPSLKDLRYVEIPPSDSEGIRTALRAGDILISITADIGIVGLVTSTIELPAYVNQHIALVRIGDEQANARYLAYFLAGAASQRRFKVMTDAGAKAGMNLTGIRQVLAAFPPTSAEQHAIAEALADSDALIESLSLLLAKKRHIKQGVTQELLTGKRRLPDFSGAWHRIRLGDVADFHKGIGLSKGQLLSAGEFPCIHYGQLFSFYGPVIKEILSFIDEPGQGLMGRVGDVLMPTSDVTPYGLAKASCLQVSGVALGGDILVIRGNPLCVHGPFLSLVIRSNTSAIQQLVSGTTVFHLYGRDMARYECLLPALDEQCAIAKVLLDMDADIEAVESRLSKARDIKQAMMQELLTGRIRLVQPVSEVIPLRNQLTKANSQQSQLSHNWQINEAVVIGMLAHRFGSEKFPLPRKRRVKLMYLLHRHVEGCAEGYLKKAAGPYDPNIKYKGPEAIALKNGYVRALRNDKYEGFIAGSKIEQAQRYFEHWYGSDMLDWLERFHYRKTDDLELLTTVDMAMVDLATSGESIDVTGIKRVIAAHPEWVPKLSRALFSDEHIASAITECQALFNG